LKSFASVTSGEFNTEKSTIWKYSPFRKNATKLQETLRHMDAFLADVTKQVCVSVKYVGANTNK